MFKKRVLILIILITFTIFLITIVSKTKQVYADTPVNASFTTSNTAPGRSSAMKIADFVYPNGSVNFDQFDVADQGQSINYSDTHWRAGYGPNQGPNLTWVEGIDAEDLPSGVRTYVCISSTQALRDAAITTAASASTNCDIFNRFSVVALTGAIEENSIILNPANSAPTSQNFNSTVFIQNRTVYLKFVTIDGSNIQSLNYTANITIINSIPDSNSTGFRTQDAFNPNDANTHDSTPIVNWTDSSDKDDGLTIDHYPADDLDYVLFIGDATPGDAQRINKPYLAIKVSQLNFSEALSNEWDTPLDLNVATITNGYANRTYFYRIITNDQYLNSLNITSGPDSSDGNFQYWDFLPQVRNISIYQSSLGALQYCDVGCTIDPVTHSNVTGLNFNVTVYDLDGDICLPSTYNARVRLCLNNTAGSPSPITCNDQLANFSYRLDGALSPGANQCTLFMTSNQGPQPSALATGTPQFFLQPSTKYRIFANISNIVNYSLPSDTNATQNWTYNIKIAATFLNDLVQETQNISVGGIPAPAANLISSGILNYNMTNWANAQYSLAWSTAPFSSGADCPSLPVSQPQANNWTPGQFGADPNYFFMLDDDGGQAFSALIDPASPTGNLYPLNLSSVLQNYEFADGIRRCISYNCNNNVNETLIHYWHIFPPAGLCPGTWRANLTFSAVQLAEQ